MHGRSRKSSRRTEADQALDRPFDSKLLAQAQEIATGYRVILEPDSEVGYIGSSIELPGVMADGPTADECVEHLREALTAAVALLLEEGRIPPAPSTLDRRTAQVNIRLTEEEKLLLEERAKRDGFRGLSDYIRATTLSTLR